MNTRAFFCGPLTLFSAVVVVGALILPTMTGLLVGAAPVALGVAMVAYLLTAALAMAFMRRHYPYADPGLCNLVTLGRLLLTCALLTPLVAPGSVWAIVAMASLVLVLDGADGWLARWQGRESDFGARFDMEVDAALGLILAVNAWAVGTVGPEVLLLGLPRYIFVAAAWHQPWLASPLPDRFGRKVVCVLQILALIALQIPALAGPVAAAIFTAALLMLSWSFGRDVLWLWRNRA